MAPGGCSDRNGEFDYLSMHLGLAVDDDGFGSVVAQLWICELWVTDSDSDSDRGIVTQ